MRTATEMQSATFICMHLFGACFPTLYKKTSVKSWKEEKELQSFWLDTETVCLKIKCSFSACKICILLLFK